MQFKIYDPLFVHHYMCSLFVHLCPFVQIFFKNINGNSNHTINLAKWASLAAQINFAP